VATESFPEFATGPDDSDFPQDKLFILFIPTKTKDGEPIQSPEVWVDEAAGMFSELFGGATEIAAKGCWKNPETGKLIREDVMLVQSYTTAELGLDSSSLNTINEFCRRMGNETSQGEVGMVIDGVFKRLSGF